MAKSGPSTAALGGAVTDEVLIKWRRRYGRITLSQARELERLERKFAHLHRQALDWNVKARR
jgi:hypothetical protein